MTDKKEMPDVIWAQKYPYAEWAHTKSQAQWQSDTLDNGKVVKYVRADTLPSREDIDKALGDLKDLFDMAIDFGDQVGGNEARTSMLFESVEKTITAMKTNLS